MMFSRYPFLLGLLLLSCLSNFVVLGNDSCDDSNQFKCKTEDLPLDEQRELYAEIEEFLGQDHSGAIQVMIRVYWHVIYDEDAGYIGEPQIRNQIETLNDAFRDSGSLFRFNLVEITYTNNIRWANVDDPEVYFEMGTVLRQGDCSTLNVYTLNQFENGYNRYYPVQLSDSCTGPMADDGIFIRFDSLPDACYPHNFGHMLIHQMGHWLGLYHTFEHGCDDDKEGDFMADTLPQAVASEGECASTNEGIYCDGLEDILANNYMDINEDQCSSEFTPNQTDWMWVNYQLYRASGLGNIRDSSPPCFSPNATAIVQNKGPVEMWDLNVGDHVLTASGTFQEVFTINHYHHSKPTRFLQLRTDLMDGAPLEVSTKHLVFVQGKKDPIPAIRVKVGDYLQTLEYGPQKVISVLPIVRNGYYNPITMDGTMIVDGIMASSYTSFTGGAYFELGGVKLFSDHSLLHMTIAPYRAFCSRMAPLLCNQHGEGELPLASQLIEDFYNTMALQNSLVQAAVLVIYVFIFALLSFLLSDYGMYSILGTIAICIYYRTTSHDKKSKQVI